jgi:hypothetical protein
LQPEGFSRLESQRILESIGGLKRKTEISGWLLLAENGSLCFSQATINTPIKAAAALSKNQTRRFIFYFPIDEIR